MDFRRFVFICGLLLSLTLEAHSGIGTDCIKGDGGSVEIGGSNCKKSIKAKIKVKGEDIHFKMTYSGAKIDSSSIELKVGTCQLSGSISHDGNHGHLHISQDIGPEFPISGKFSRGGVSFANVQQKFGCTVTKTRVEDGFEVKIEYNPKDADLSGLKINFDDAVLVNVDDANVSLWGVTGWRLWVTISGCCVLAILLSASSICSSCSRKKDQKKNSQPPANENVESKKSKRSAKPTVPQLSNAPTDKYGGNKNWMIIEQNSEREPVKKPDVVVDKAAAKLPDEVADNTLPKMDETKDDPNALDQIPGTSRQNNQNMTNSKDASKDFHWPIDSFTANDMLAMRQAGATNNQDVLNQFVESHPLPADALNKIARPMQKYAEELEQQIQQPNGRPMEVEEDNLSMIQKLLPIISEKCAKQE
ncbi:hypothetical protein M3Y96_01240600 [Aphelenchoides besseyi]|nr:hypothetical protein M3Y96_01240600 [Aphelenchoides besseyi]